MHEAVEGLGPTKRKIFQMRDTLEPFALVEQVKYLFIDR